MRLIDADEILDTINNENYPDYPTYSDIFNVIDSAPTIEAEPVRRGWWLDSGINHTVSFPCPPAIESFPVPPIIISFTLPPKKDVFSFSEKRKTIFIRTY